MIDEEFEPKARPRKRKKPKERMSWDQRCEDLEDWELRRTYRMARPTFDYVLHSIGPRLWKDESKARMKAQAAGYNFIEPELRLSMTLRFDKESGLRHGVYRCVRARKKYSEQAVLRIRQ